LTGPAGGVKKEELEELFRTVDDIVGTNHLACERMSKIVQSLRGSPLLDEGEFVQVNPNREIESSLALLAHAFRNRIRLIKDYGDLPEIECDPGRIGQVFLNILINAVQAIEGEGEIRIRTWREGDTVRIAIRDNGKGIAAEFRSRIFDPGFTTKSVDSGTGLGLFICRRIVRQHGGRIDVESEERKGASFTITLPIRHTQERKTDDWRI
jgi:signal transduction histidine kinase